MEPLADITATLLFDFLEVREVLRALRHTGTSGTREALDACQSVQSVGCDDCRGCGGFCLTRRLNLQRSLQSVCLTPSGLRPRLDEAVPGPVLEAHPAAQRGILSQVSSQWRRVQTLAESVTHRSGKLKSRWLSQQSLSLLSSPESKR